jgi:hypothetical protein
MKFFRGSVKFPDDFGAICRFFDVSPCGLTGNDKSAKCQVDQHFVSGKKGTDGLPACPWKRKMV